jgi:transcriptional regulator with XRE-family HTH domain
MPVHEQPPVYSSADLLQRVGERVRDTRLAQGLTQASLADRAGISVRALRDLEAGRGAQLATFVRALKGLGAESAIENLLPTPGVSPMALLERPRRRQRGYR